MKSFARVEARLRSRLHFGQVLRAISSFLKGRRAGVKERHKNYGHGKLGFVLLAGIVVSLLGPIPSAKAQTKTLTEWTLPTAGSRPLPLRVAPDGTAVFTELVGRVGILDPSTNTITEWSVNPNSSPLGVSIAPFLFPPGADITLAFSENKANAVAELDVFRGQGSIAGLSEVTLPEPSSAPVGTSWAGTSLFFAEGDGNRIGSMSRPALNRLAEVVEWAIPTPNAGPNLIVVVYNRSSLGSYDVWFGEAGASKIGQLHIAISPATGILGAATFTEWLVPGNASPAGLAVSNGQVFFGN